ncbi:MAG: flagellar biosynthesis protein FlhB [Candidatus Zixiibacteriota bacterium]
MAERDSAQEKTEQATPNRLRKALEEGKVSKSQELSSVAVMGLGFLALYAMGPLIVHETTNVMRHVFSQAPLMSLGPASFTVFFRDNVASFFITVGPFLLVMVLIGALINVSQVGFRFSAKPLEPKFEKLNPFEGLKRLFKPKTLVEFARDSIKVLLVLFLGYTIIASDAPNFLELVDSSTYDFAREFGLLALLLVMKIAGVMLILAIFDFAYQRYDYKKELRMSKQEVKEESKDTEGNPELKSRVRQVQRDMARKRMMSEVPSADVVITNPTHIAVALKYDRDMMEAPTVVAKGQRLIAERIKEIARASGVAVVENKPLARSLFDLCTVGMAIPMSLYKAVAEILAQVYQMQNREA